MSGNTTSFEDETLSRLIDDEPEDTEDQDEEQDEEDDEESE